MRPQSTHDITLRVRAADRHARLFHASMHADRNQPNPNRGQQMRSTIAQALRTLADRLTVAPVQSLTRPHTEAEF